MKCPGTVAKSVTGGDGIRMMTCVWETTSTAIVAVILRLSTLGIARFAEYTFMHSWTQGYQAVSESVT